MSSSRTETTNRREQMRQEVALEKRRARDRRIVIISAITLVALVVAGVVGYAVYNQVRKAEVARGELLAPQQLAPGQPASFGSNPDAVAVDLFIDFQCPHCQKAETALGPTMQKLAQEGKIRLNVYPLTFEGEASVRLANGFACAVNQGGGLDYMKAVYDPKNFALAWTADQVKDVGTKVVGDHATEFQRCVDSNADAQWVQSITKAATDRKVTGTPSLYVNGQPYQGSVADLTPQQFTQLVAS